MFCRELISLSHLFFLSLSHYVWKENKYSPDDPIAIEKIEGSLIRMSAFSSETKCTLSFFFSPAAIHSVLLSISKLISRNWFLMFFILKSTTYWSFHTREIICWIFLVLFSTFIYIYIHTHLLLIQVSFIASSPIMRLSEKKRR